jgi:hypothetical protein
MRNFFYTASAGVCFYCPGYHHAAFFRGAKHRLI